ncbi:MAG: XRE family transcriptional regulator [Methylobacteriaceae bacterium]|jgi:transcriptional regulator with XRE-family HTH domain|nr:XRE family transcriptional regulator [Methylobacteriaceae bacterium]
MSDNRRRNPSIGQVLRERRAYHGWTLADLSERSGISKSTLSKIENDLISPSYQSILQLCAGLNIEIGDLVAGSTGRDDAPKPLTGRRSVSYGHTGLTMGDDHFTYTYLCTEIAHKRIIPAVIDVRVNSFHDLDGLWNHVGEEFIYVLKGEIELHTEFYETTVLKQGDSAYFDTTMGYAYVAAGGQPAQILVCCSSATPNLAQTLREELAQRLNRRRKQQNRGAPAD